MVGRGWKMGIARSSFLLVSGVSFIAATVYSVASVRAANADRVLATALANDRAREAAITSIVAAGNSRVPLLLSWTRKPPSHVVTCGLYTGLADAFGRLRTKAAIPFLIENIAMRRSCGADFAPWLKTPRLIEWNLPAVGALVQIGPDASRAVIAAARRGMVQEDNLAAIFVVAQVGGVPEAGVFLRSALGRANMEAYRAEQGLELLEANRSNGK